MRFSWLRGRNRDLDHRLKDISLINEFSQSIVSTLDFDELYGVLDHFLGERLGFKEFALLLRNEESGEVVVQIARGFAETARVQGMRFRPGEGVTGQVLLSRESCYIPDTRKEPGYLYYKGEKGEDGSFLSIPLLFKGKVVGILNFTRPEVGAFSPVEIEFLKTIAVQVAIALVNARLYSQIRELAIRDELTELFNRRHFQSFFPLEVRRAGRFHQPLSLLMVDIDRFKYFNDTNGHLKGDESLKSVGRFLKSSLRVVDIVVRFGGEEFVILLPNTAKKDAEGVAEKLRTAVGREHPFTLSIGVASYPEDGEAPEELLNAADTALYQAKHEGRNRVVTYAAAGQRVDTFRQLHPPL